MLKHLYKYLILLIILIPSISFGQNPEIEVLFYLKQNAGRSVGEGVVYLLAHCGCEPAASPQCQWGAKWWIKDPCGGSNETYLGQGYRADLSIFRTSTYVAQCYEGGPKTEITIQHNEDLQKPVFQINEVTHPIFTDSKTVKLTVSGCNLPNQLLWLKGGGNGQSFIINDPYDCDEYQVACTNGCDTLKSEVLVPSKNFHPTNSGYSQIFINHVNNQVAKANAKGEKFYRKQYQCILNSSIGQSWRFVKYNFDYMATHLQCNRSIELDNNASFGISFRILGAYHFARELTPSFIIYPAFLNTCSDLDRWREEHEAFLNYAVIACFDQMAASSELNNSEKEVVKCGKVQTLTLVRGLREYLIFGRKLLNNCFFNTLTSNYIASPLPPVKADLFSQELSDVSVLKVKAVIDTTFFVKTKTNVQLKIIKTLPNGTKIDLTNGPSGTTYSLSLDTNIVNISPNGLLTIKRTDLPYSNNRLPFVIEVKNGSDIGYGQFAIYDTDIDNDFLADTFEEKGGLNPNISNPINLDSDQDGIEDFFELSFLTSPLKSDTDGDGYSDKIEMLKGTDANSSLSYPYPIYSIQSGSWNNSSSWSCNCIPTLNDAVIIKSGHNIELNSTMGIQECLKIDTEKGAIFNCTGILKTFLK